MKSVEERKSKGVAGNIPVFCAFDKIVSADELQPNPKNPNQHPEDQIELLAKVIQTQGWRAPVTVSTLSGLIVRGHGRYMAAKMLGCPVPVDYQNYATEAEEMADLLADNRIAELSEMDNKMLAEIFAGIDENQIDTALTGYSQEDIAQLNESLTEAVMADIDEIKSKSEVSTHKLKIDKTVVELTDDEYDLIMQELNSYVDINGVSFGFVRWLLNDSDR